MKTKVQIEVTIEHPSDRAYESYCWHLEKLILSADFVKDLEFGIGEELDEND